MSSPTPLVSTPPPSSNPTLFQAFEWNIPSDTRHWTRLCRYLPSLKAIGIDNIWLPPACKGGGPSSNGYDIYDHFDLGEFDQRGSRSTKWGSKEDLMTLVQEARRAGVGLVFDAVLNHRCGGDEVERVWAVVVDPKDHTIPISDPQEIQSWLKFNFPGRNGAYSPFQLTWHQFNGTDWDQVTGKKAIYKITSDGKDWADDVDKTENGNADYLMMNNLDYSDQPLREEMKYWGTWVTRELGLAGFRLDATQHVSHGFTNEWMQHIALAVEKKLFYVGEFWHGDVRPLLSWLNRSPEDFYLMDAPLFYNMANISWAESPDLRRVFYNTLVQVKPNNAVTFAMNHDTQKGQAMDQPVKPQFVPHAYALILLRRAGYPCVFYGDLFGICDPFPSPPTGYGKLADLILARKLYAYGTQVDYFDRPDCIGWVRMGRTDVDGSASTGMAVMLSWVNEEANSSLTAIHDLAIRPEAGGTNSNVLTIQEYVRHGLRTSRRSWHGTPNSGDGDGGGGGIPVIRPKSSIAPSPRKRMYVGEHRAGEVWKDLLGWEWAEVKIDGDGYGVFPCQKNKIAVFVNATAEGREKFPVGFEGDIYRQDV